METCYWFFLGKIVFAATAIWFMFRFAEEIDFDKIFVDKVVWKEKDSPIFLGIAIFALFAFLLLLILDPNPYWPEIF